MNWSQILNKKNLLLSITLIAALTLSLETWLQFYQGSSLCQTSGCKVVGDFLRFGESILVAIGALFFLLLTILIILVRNLNRPWVWLVLYILLFGALAFDGALLGYQFIGVQEKCLLCLMVGLGLGLTILVLAWERSSLFIAFCGLTVFMAGFSANSILKVTPNIPCLEETAFVRKEAQIKNPKLNLYLYFSLHCGHCMKVLANLAVNSPWQANWYLSAADSRPEDLYRLTQIKKRANQNNNLFKAVLQVKQLKKVEPCPIPKEIKQAVEKARTYFRCNNFYSVPILIAEEGQGRRIYNVGVRNIMVYLIGRNIIKKRVIFQK